MDSDDSRDTVVHVGEGYTEDPDGPECYSLEGECSDFRSDDGRLLDTADHCSASQEYVTLDEVSVSATSPERTDTPLTLTICSDRLSREALADLYRPLFSLEEDETAEVRFIQDEFELQIPEDADSDLTDFILGHVGRVLLCLIGKRFVLLYNIFDRKTADRDVETASVSTQPLSSNVLHPPIPHLILWAALFNKENILLELIQRSEYPLGFALLVSVLYKSLSEISDDNDKGTSDVWKQRARTMESLACDITVRLGQQGRDVAVFSVGERMDLFGQRDATETPIQALMMSPFEIAKDGRLVHFLASSSVQAYSRRIFYNEIDIGRRYWVFLMIFWIPPLPLILASSWRLVKYNLGRYLDRPAVQESDTFPDSLFFHIIDKLSPFPSPNLQGTRMYQDSSCRTLCSNLRLCAYYSAPANVYQYYLISHVCLLIIFIHTLLHDMSLEWLVAAWFSAFLLSDLHQVLTCPGQNAFHGVCRNSKNSILQSVNWTPSEIFSLHCDSRLFHALRKWMCDEWQWVNVVMYTLFFAGVACSQSSSVGSGIGRVLYACAVLLSYVKLLRFCVLWKTVATSVIRISLIARKVIPLMLVVIVVCAGFGVVYVCLVHPPGTGLVSPGQATLMVFLRPLGHLLGTLRFDDIHQEMKVAARNTCLEEDFDMWDPDSWSSCYPGWMATFLTTVFVGILNLVLFTYIVGVASQYYQRTKERADQIYAVEMHRLIEWCAELPLPPPPLNLVWLLVRLLLTVCLLVFIAVMHLAKKRKRLSDPEEMMLTFPRSFRTYVNVIWVLTWLYKSPPSQYTRPNPYRRKCVAQVFHGDSPNPATYQSNTSTTRQTKQRA